MSNRNAERPRSARLAAATTAIAAFLILCPGAYAFDPSPDPSGTTTADTTVAPADSTSPAVDPTSATGTETTPATGTDTAPAESDPIDTGSVDSTTGDTPPADSTSGGSQPAGPTSGDTQTSEPTSGGAGQPAGPAEDPAGTSGDPADPAPVDSNASPVDSSPVVPPPQDTPAVPLEQPEVPVLSITPPTTASTPAADILSAPLTGPSVTPLVPLATPIAGAEPPAQALGGGAYKPSSAPRGIFGSLARTLIDSLLPPADAGSVVATLAATTLPLGSPVVGTVPPAAHKQAPAGGDHPLTRPRPEPTAPGSGGGVSSGSAGPAGGGGLSLIALPVVIAGLLLVLFELLRLAPARWRSVAVVSLIERPG